MSTLPQPWADHGGDAVSREMDLRAVAERLEPQHLDLFELEQTTPPGNAARLSQRREAHLQPRAVRNQNENDRTAQLPISRSRAHQTIQTLHLVDKEVGPPNGLGWPEETGYPHETARFCVRKVRGGYGW